MKHITLLGVLPLTLLLAGACSDETQESTPRDSMVEMTDRAEGRAVTLTGCLQESNGDFVLTTLNTPPSVPTPVPTTGNNATGSSSPAADQLEAAQRSYMLDGDEDRLKAHIGRHVRVMGTVEERSEVPMAAAQPSSERPDLDTGDLAEVSVDSIERLAESCGDGSTSVPSSIR